MNKWIFAIIGCFLFIVLSHYSLLKVQSEGYRLRLALKECALNVLFIAVSECAYLLCRKYFVVGIYLLEGALFLLAIYLLIRYLKKRILFKYTNRGIRLSFPYFLISLGLILLSPLIEPYNSLLTFVVVFLRDVLLCALNALISPLERKRNFKFVSKNTEILRNKEIIKVVITGSYGKTTCKRILLELLKNKYQVLQTEGNFNTPMGLLKSVEKHKESFENSGNVAKTLLFIGEAGARSKGDVEEMCKLINPTYGIVTGVCPQHLKSFGSLEKIASTKEELPRYIGKNGVVVFNGENSSSLKMSENFLGKSIVVGKNGCVSIEHLKMTLRGSTFTLTTKSGDIPLKTTLVGRHNAVNVALCVALALELKVEKEEIIEAIRRVKCEPHRFEVKEEGGLFVVDDGYNGNIEGAKSALEVLKECKGRKIIYSQGIVECGKMERALNREVGRLVGNVADVVILSGINAKNIEKGLKEGGFNGKIYKFPSITHATEGLKHILKQGDILYLQNDIP